MKFRLQYAVLIISCFISCVDALDIAPENSVTFKNAIETEREVEVALFAAETKLRSGMTANYWNLISFGEYSDYHGSYSPALLDAGAPSNYMFQWVIQYDLIAAANVPLPYIDKINMPQKRKDFYKGQVYFFKAFAYLDLIRRWGNCVLIRDKVEIEPLGQTAWPEVADYAISLAKDAVRLLPELNELKDYAGNTITHRARPCKGAANALLAQLCAWKAGSKYMAQPDQRDYDEQELWKIAEEACSSIIERNDLYSLADNPEKVCTEVLVGNSSETILESLYKDWWQELEYSEDNFTSMGKYYESWPVIPNENMTDIKTKEYRISNTSVRKMFPEYIENGKKHVDLRRDAWFYNFEDMEKEDEMYTGGYAYPNKFRSVKVGTEGWNAGEFVNFDQDKIWWRLADIILLRAECRARLGGEYLQGAIDDLNTIRNRAGAKRYDISEYGGDLRYAIFKESEKEFLIEGGRRWFDILRNGYYATELYGNYRTVSEQDIIDGVFFSAIEKALFKNNPLMRQNTYWQKRM